MTPRTLFCVSTSFVGFIFCAGVAQAQMTCATYLRGVAAQDDYVLHEAATIAARLIDSAWASPAMKSEAKDLPPSTDLRQRLMLRQLSRDCRVLSRETIEKLVAIHLATATAD
jgi:hypothetical protein